MITRRSRRRLVAHLLPRPLVAIPAARRRLGPITMVSMGTGTTASLVPCWFEPGVNGSVTACCDRGDGTFICSELRWG